MRNLTKPQSAIVNAIKNGAVINVYATKYTKTIRLSNTQCADWKHSKVAFDNLVELGIVKAIWSSCDKNFIKGKATI